MSASEQKVKVLVADLIARVEEEKANARKQHERDLEAFPAKLEKWRSNIHSALIAAVDKLTENKDDFFQSAYSSQRGHRVSIPCKGDGKAPEKPTLNLSQFDADIRLLKMCADETILVGHYTKFARYL